MKDCQMFEADNFHGCYWKFCGAPFKGKTIWKKIWKYCIIDIKMVKGFLIFLPKTFLVLKKFSNETILNDNKNFP